MNTLIVLSALFALSQACDMPKGFESGGEFTKAPKFTPCDGEAPSSEIELDLASASISPYPIHKGDKTMLTFKYNNKGTEIGKPNLKVDIDAYHYGGLFGCSYHHIVPNFHGYDACDVFGNCPLKAGQNTHSGQLKIPMIDTALGLYGTGKVYKIQMKVKDSSSGKVLGCMVAEAVTA